MLKTGFHDNFDSIHINGINIKEREFVFEEDESSLGSKKLMLSKQVMREVCQVPINQIKNVQC